MNTPQKLDCFGWRSLASATALAATMLLAACGSDPIADTSADSTATSPTTTSAEEAEQPANEESNYASEEEAEDPKVSDEDERDRLEMASRDLAVELVVPEQVGAGVPFDVEVGLSVQSIGASGVDLTIVLPEGVEVLAGGVCPAGSGTIECVDAVPEMTLVGSASVRMVWNPAAGVETAVIEISVTDEGIDLFGMDEADGNAVNNTNTATLTLSS